MATRKKKRNPIILCAGQYGRCVVYGYVDADPKPGEPVELHQARMVLYWTKGGGLFGVAAEGPESGSRLTPAVSRTVETVWQEWISVTPKAAKVLDTWV